MTDRQKYGRKPEADAGQDTCCVAESAGDLKNV